MYFNFFFLFYFPNQLLWSTLLFNYLLLLPTGHFAVHVSNDLARRWQMMVQLQFKLRLMDMLLVALQILLSCSGENGCQPFFFFYIFFYLAPGINYSFVTVNKIKLTHVIVSHIVNTCSKNHAKWSIGYMPHTSILAIIPPGTDRHKWLSLLMNLLNPSWYRFNAHTVKTITQAIQQLAYLK